MDTPRQPLDAAFHDALTQAGERLAAAGVGAEDIQQRVSKAVPAAIKAAGVDLAETLTRRAPDMLKERSQLHREFSDRLAQHWASGLDLLYVVTVCCQEAGADFDERQRPAGVSRPELHEALTGLHARASRVGLEVHHLLAGGFGAGALARCRTLHELAVTANVLRGYGTQDAHADLGERFLRHHDVLNWRDAQVYQEQCEVLGTEPFDDQVMAALEERSRALVSRFGSGYRHQYGWASGLGGYRQLTLPALEILAGVSQLRGYYGWANHEVHADAKGSQLNIVERSGQLFRLSGPSNAGLADPGQLAAISLHQITTALVLSVSPPTPSDLMVLHAINSLVDDTCQALAEGEKAVTRAEARYQAQRAGEHDWTADALDR